MSTRAYKKWPRTRWHESPFADLTKPGPNGQTLFLFLTIGPFCTAIPGVIARCGRAAIAEELGDWSADDVDRIFGELAALAGAEADWSARLLFLPAVAADDVPENPNAVRAWRRAFNELPGCALKARIDDQVRAFLHRQDAERPIHDREKQPIAHAWIRAWDEHWQPSSNVPETFLVATSAERSGNVSETSSERSDQRRANVSATFQAAASDANSEAQPSRNLPPTFAATLPEPVAVAVAEAVAEAPGWLESGKPRGSDGGSQGEETPSRVRYRCPCGALVSLTPEGQRFNADGTAHVSSAECTAARSRRNGNDFTPLAAIARRSTRLLSDTGESRTDVSPAWELDEAGRGVPARAS